MNRKNKGNSPFRRAAAFLMAAALTLSMIPSMPMVSYADGTELLPAPGMKENGGGLTTAYKWSPTGDYGSTNLGKFDIEGIEDASLIGADAPYLGNRDKAVITTYAHNGYETVVQSPTSGSYTQLEIAKNGGVEAVDDLGIEVQMKVYPSPDKKWILVDYIVYNKRNTPNTIQLASGTDVQVGGKNADGGGSGDPADASALVANDRGFHMVNSKTQQTFDCIYNDPGLGLTVPTTRWVGLFSARNGKYFANGPYKVNPPFDTNGRPIDSGLTYSWTIPLRPYEKVLRRVAFAAKGPSYYVSDQWGDDATTQGSYDHPFKTIEAAIRKVGENVGYIYIEDYGSLASPITVPAKANITFSSSDYGHDGNPTSTIITLQRAGTFTNAPMFTTNGGTMRFTNLVLDGNKTAASANTKPILSASAGTVGILSGTVLQNNQVAGNDVGSAIDITGTANLDMNFGQITGNVSNGKGAVNFDSTGEFAVQNKIDIENNTNQQGGKANVYLAQGKHMTVADNLQDSKIGVTTAQKPQVSPGGSSTQAAQEVVVAVPKANSPMDVAPSPFSGSFLPDQGGTGGNGVYITPGTANLPGTTNNDKNTVLKINGFTITISAQDSDFGSSIPGAPSFPPVTKAAGEAVDIAPPGAITGYNLEGVDIIQGTSQTLHANLTQGTDFGRITGTMPAQDVTVNYLYKKQASSITFVANGGTPQPSTMTGTAGMPVNGLMPSVSRYGYIFKGWSTTNDKQNPQYVADLPAEYPASPVTYYAIFEADTNVKFSYTVEHANQSGSITFESTTQANQYYVEHPLAENAAKVPGYVFSLGDSSTTPSTYDYNGQPDPVGTFATTGAFTGKMPGQDLTVRYRYQVDPAVKFPFVVKYETESGDVVAPESSNSHQAEETFSVGPQSPYGYQCIGHRFDLGQLDGKQPDGSLVKPVGGSFDGSFNWTGPMPNQPVTLVYLYKSTLPGYQVTVKYQDNQTQDNSLKDIIPPVDGGTYQAAASASGSYQQQYGYTYASGTVNPVGTLQIDGSTHNWSGTMPREDVQVAYYHNRDASKWADITYKAGTGGTLSIGTGVSPDVAALGDGSYKASVLINDGSDQGRLKAYTLQDIQDKRLAPRALANQYYSFDGWFVDANGDGQMDQGESLLPANYQFTGPATLTAHFGEVSGKWVTVTFQAGEHGSIDAGQPVTLRTTYDKTWGDIAQSLPHYTPEVNYLVDGWFNGDNRMAGVMPLADGGVYTIRFYPDPVVFGTNVATPEAVAGLDGQGKGKITAYNTTAGYKYILADPSGKILQVVTGDQLTGRVVFGGLYPGARYQVFEATAKTQAQVGGQMSQVRGTISQPIDLLTPVVVDNYQVTYDQEQGETTQLTINPADPASDYALLDQAGNVVTTPQTDATGWLKPSGSPASLSFTGLGYNKEYTVVARPTGQTQITAQSRREDGSQVTTDPGGQPDLPQYIVETLGGQITSVGGVALGVDRYEQAHKGDQVSIQADQVNQDGQPFSHWEITIGSLNGQITGRQATFTMPESNLVLTAVYQPAHASPSNATVTYQVRGGSREKLALSPEEVPRLEAELTTQPDRELMDVNHADVTYKVIYQKGTVRATESNAIKASGDYDTDHEGAYKAAWGLDVSIERYVNGRQVRRATASNASFKTYMQLDRQDVDMMDYQLYQIQKDPGTGQVSASLVATDDDPEQTGGLFTFTATEGDRYVLVYNQAYRVYFLNDVAMPLENRYRYHFKVRQGEAPADSYYDYEYGQVAGQLEHFLGSDGADYTYQGWSYGQDKLKAFDPEKEIRGKTLVYAYYDSNKQQVESARSDLEAALQEAIRVGDDHFLKPYESQQVKEIILEALAVLDKENPKATEDQLKQAIGTLKEKILPYQQILAVRYGNYQDMQEEGSKGGSGGGGGSGSGSRIQPFISQPSIHYTVGVDGNWVEAKAAGNTAPAGGKQLSFVLNGGTPLSDIWAWLKVPADVKTGSLESAGWYHFSTKGIMETGWVRDDKGVWYYCNTQKDGIPGMMATGWKQDGQDGNWYYLNPKTGAMALGWQKINDKWYYFDKVGAGVYAYDKVNEKWTYGGGKGRPLGSMYKNEKTPDGYQVGPDGAWIQ